MPGRTWQGIADAYRYSHNGHEKEDQIYAGAQSAEYWMYDSRILRRWDTDPLTYANHSPYLAFNGNPIFYADPLGLEGKGDGDKGKNKTKKREDNANKKAKEGTWSEDKNGKLVYDKDKKPEPKPDEEPKDGEKSKAPKFTLSIGNTAGPWSIPTQQPWAIQTPFSSQNVSYYNTPVSGINSLSEPAYLGHFQWQYKGASELGVLVYKQKINPFANTFKFEATTHISFTYSRFFPLYNSKNFSVNADVSGGGGFVIAMTKFTDPTVGTVNLSPIHIGFPDQEQYQGVGLSATAITRIDATFVKNYSIFVSMLYNRTVGWDIPTSIGAQSLGSLGSAQIVIGASIKIK